MMMMIRYDTIRYDRRV